MPVVETSHPPHATDEAGSLSLDAEITTLCLRWRSASSRTSRTSPTREMKLSTVSLYARMSCVVEVDDHARARAVDEAAVDVVGGPEERLASPALAKPGGALTIAREVGRAVDVEYEEAREVGVAGWSGTWWWLQPLAQSKGNKYLEPDSTSRTVSTAGAVSTSALTKHSLNGT
jgi:hypothetical protein